MSSVNNCVQEFNEIYDKFQTMYQECLKLLAYGVQQEEISNEEQALQTYKSTIELIDKAMQLPISFPAEMATLELEQKLKDLKKIIYNFKMQRSEILLRIGTIYRRKENEEADRILNKQKELKDDSSSSTDKESPKPRQRTYEELTTVLQNLSKVQQNTDNQVRENILEVLFCCNGVKLYYIENNGEVVSSLQEFVLRICLLGTDFERNLDETIFMQLIKSVEVGQEVDENSSENGESSTNANASRTVEDDPSFIYPLIPGVSPLFRTKFNAFILPDLQSNDGSAIGMIIPKEFDDIALDILVTILKGIVKENGEVEFANFAKLGDESRAERSTGDKVSENMVSGAYWISDTIVKGAQKTGELMDYSTPYILSKISQSKENTQAPSEKVNTSLTVAKNLTGYAAQGTSFLASKVCGAMSSFGRYLAPHVQYQGTRLLTYAIGVEEEEADNTMKETLKIVSGAAESISTIYSGLETSASILGRNLADNSVKIVRHKYGDPYGEISSKGFDTVGNLIAVKRSFNIFTPKGLVKSTAKSAGKGILDSEEFKPKVYINRDYFTGQPCLYPNLDELAKEISKQNP